MEYLTSNLYIYLSILMSCLFASIIIPNVLVVSFRKRLFDMPNSRKVHKNVVPRLGGVAFAPIIISTMSIISSLVLMGVVSGDVDDISSNAIVFLLSLGALIFLYLMGLKDDLVGVRYNTKFIIQIIAGTLIFASGLRVTNFYGFLLLGELNFVMSYLVTIFLVVFVVNSINLIDGIDGLASGLSIIASVYYGVIFVLNGDTLYAMLAFTVIGTLLPFFRYNVFGNAKSKRRKIFMGDTGSLTIGFVLSVLSIKAFSIDVLDGGNGVFISFAPLLLPCFDVVRVTLYRLSIGAPPFKPDRNHIHHKFLDAGLSNRQSLILILIISTLSSFIMVSLSRYVDVNLLFLLNIVIWIIMFQTLKRLTTTCC